MREERNERNELSKREKGRAVENDMVKIVNGFFTVSNT